MKREIAKSKNPNFLSKNKNKLIKFGSVLYLSLAMMASNLSIAAAEETNKGGQQSEGNFITNTILGQLIAFLAPVIAIGLIIFVVVQGLRLLKGAENGSVKKLVSGTVLFICMLGIMYASKSFNLWGNAFSGAVNTVVDTGGKNVNTIVGGNSSSESSESGK